MQKNTLEASLKVLLKKFEQQYSRYLPESEISLINTHAAHPDGYNVKAQTVPLMNYAATVHAQSDGLFDITSGVLREVWNFREEKLPSPSQLEAILPKIGWHKVKWNPPNIHFCETQMQLDFGGFGKEYAADFAAAHCIEAGITHGLVSLGGDLTIIGPHPSGAPWRVGIAHPRKPGVAIAHVELLSGAIATSGDYERFMVIEGVRYSHLLNPKTGCSIRPHFCAVSVVAPSCLLAGSFSTIAMLKSEFNPNWLKDSGLSYLTIDQNMDVGGTVLVV